MIRLITCRSCKQQFPSNKLVEALQLDTLGRIHIRGECPKCRSFIKFVAYSDSNHVRDILQLFYHNDLDALYKIHDEVVYNYKKKEIQ